MVFSNDQIDLLKSIVDKTNNGNVLLGDVLFHSKVLKELKIRLIAVLQNNKYAWSVFFPQSYTGNKNAFVSDYNKMMTLILPLYDLMKDEMLYRLPGTGNMMGTCYSPGYKITGTNTDTTIIYFDDNSYLDLTNNTITIPGEAEPFIRMTMDAELDFLSSLLPIHVVCSPKFQELALNDFESYENKTLKWTRITAIISMIAVIISIILGLIELVGD